MRVLVVTAVEAERQAVVAALPYGVALPSDGAVSVQVGGVGPAEAAAATSAALARSSVDLVLSVGIGGGFAPSGPGEIAVASAVVFGDLGAETADGFVSASALGFGRDRYDIAPKLALELADRTGGRLGTILTVATVTGSAARADALVERYPDVVAEAMEGAGVAAAARLHGVAFGEIRAISNVVGPRDREAWRIPQALAALGLAVTRAVVE